MGLPQPLRSLGHAGMRAGLFPCPGVSPVFVGSLGHAPAPLALLSPAIPPGLRSSWSRGSAVQHSPAGSQPAGEAARSFGEASALAEPGEQPVGGGAGGRRKVMVRLQRGALGHLGWFGAYSHACSGTERGHPVCWGALLPAPRPLSQRNTLPEERAGISGNLFAW